MWHYQQNHSCRPLTQPTEPHQLTPQQIKALDLLALGAKYTSVAEQVGCSRKTLYNWLDAPDFKGELQTLMRLRREETIAELRALSGQAVTTLKQVLADPDTPPAVLANTAFRILAMTMQEGLVAEIPGAGRKDGAIDPEVLERVSEAIYG